MERFDVVVVGAGPAGSATAYRLARAGARVALLDRARFPRDKPCGGGLTRRALRELPVPVDPVVEDAAARVELHLHGRRRFERRSADPLVLLTRRSRLDALLASHAAEAGADFRDSVRVTGVEVEPDGVVVRAGRDALRAAAVVGADGANGIVARAVGLASGIERGVGLEGNLPLEHAGRDRRGLLTLDFGAPRGGYGWVFPKADHVNVGVGGWASEGPRLRAHLRRLCKALGLPFERLEGVVGHRLPMRRPRPGDRLARGRAAVVGDAAGLVDPFSGDGIYEALLSGRLVADASLDLLAGRSEGLDPYHDELTAATARLAVFSWTLKHAFDRFPRLALTLVRLPAVWPAVEAVVDGELDRPGAANGAARAPLRALRALGRNGLTAAAPR